MTFDNPGPSLQNVQKFMIFKWNKQIVCRRLSTGNSQIICWCFWVTPNCSTYESDNFGWLWPPSKLKTAAPGINSVFPDFEFYLLLPESDASQLKPAVPGDNCLGCYLLNNPTWQLFCLYFLGVLPSKVVHELDAVATPLAGTTWLLLSENPFHFDCTIKKVATNTNTIYKYIYKS